MVKKGRSDMAGRGKGNNSGWLTLKVGEREVLYWPPQNKLKAGTLQSFLASNSTSQEQCFFNGIPSTDPVYKEKWKKKKTTKEINKIWNAAPFQKWHILLRLVPWNLTAHNSGGEVKNGFKMISQQAAKCKYNQVSFFEIFVSCSVFGFLTYCLYSYYS